MGVARDLHHRCIFFSFVQDVVADIDRALEAGFKKPQIFKLYKRKASSLVKLGKIKEARRGTE